MKQNCHHVSKQYLFHLFLGLQEEIDTEKEKMCFVKGKCTKSLQINWEKVAHRYIKNSCSSNSI